MDWFFIDKIETEALLTGEDAHHITKSLRMSVGEAITLCDKEGKEHLCRIERISTEGVFVRVISSAECENEPTVNITLFASLTKGDKMEHVIQKAVELGIFCIVPTLTARCISRPDEKAASKKLLRYRKIAEQAAMQSRRGIIPEIKPFTDLREASQSMGGFDKALLFYEGGGKPMKDLIFPSDKSIAMFTGPEGGFEEREVELLTLHGAVTATLGKRILRAETAPLAALSAIMFHTGNLE